MAKTATKAKTKPAAKAKAGKVEKIGVVVDNTKKPAALGANRSVPLDAKIKVLRTADEARRPGSKAHLRFRCYKDGQTVREWIEATKKAKVPGRIANVKKDIKRGNIKLA